MSKLEFMKELEGLLLDIPLDEREEALRYYNGYFEDAGEEHEEEVLKELGSPVKVAKLIKADLVANAEERENRGYFTENGYKVVDDGEEKYEIIGSATDGKKNREQTGSAYNQQSTFNQGNNNQSTGYSQGTSQHQDTNNEQGMNRSQNNNYNQNSTNNQNSNQNQYSNYNQNNNYNRNSNYGSNQNNYQNTNFNQNQYNKTQSENRNSNTGLLILLAIFTSPIWLPLVLGVMGIAIGIITAILGVIFGFGIAGVSMIVVGISLFVAGLIQISVPFIGAIMIGGGLIVLGIGMLLTLGCIVLCKNVLPALVRGFAALCRRPFRNRRVMA